MTANPRAQSSPAWGGATRRRRPIRARSKMPSRAAATASARHASRTAASRRRRARRSACSARSSRASRRADLFFDGVRVEGVSVEDGAHVHLAEERLEERLEAVKRLRAFARRARRLDLFDEALQRLPVLVHQVAQAPLVERVEPFGELRVRIAVGRRAVHELDEPPEVEAECERLFELRAEGVEQLFAVERRVEVLSERHDRLPVAVAQEPAGVLGLRENLRRLAHRAETHKLVLEGLAHLHADGVGRAVKYVSPRLLQTFGVQSAALYEVQQRTRLLVDEREDGEQALEFAVAVERNFDEAQKAEQAREGLEDGEHAFAQLVR